MNFIHAIFVVIQSNGAQWLHGRQTLFADDINLNNMDVGPVGVQPDSIRLS